MVGRIWPANRNLPTTELTLLTNSTLIHFVTGPNRSFHETRNSSHNPSLPYLQLQSPLPTCLYRLLYARTGRGRRQSGSGVKVPLLFTLNQLLASLSFGKTEPMERQSINTPDFSPRSGLSLPLPQSIPTPPWIIIVSNYYCLLGRCTNH